ncbi:hypothetical protein N7488_003656 [Penicillium malachiteum]|nr:hypothetical protein N7488_003656 [Penicillium malachiteum]
MAFLHSPCIGDRMEHVNLQDRSTKFIKILVEQIQDEYFEKDQTIFQYREALEEYRHYNQNKWDALDASAENLMRHVSRMQENDEIGEIFDKARQVLIGRGDEYAV